MNIADWRPEDYVPAPSSAYLAMLAALEPGVLRWPAGHRSQEYVWERGGDGQGGSWVLTPTHLDAFVALAKAVRAEPLIGINVKRGTTAAAADLVRYLNVDRRFGVRWFYIGNEPDLTDGITASPEVCADQLIAYVDAMRAVDPSIHIVGPELLTGAHVQGIHQTVDWMAPILARVGARLSGISWHYYPLDSAQRLGRSSATVSIPHLFQETAPDWAPAGLSFADEVMPALSALRDAHAPGATIWITELAEDPGPRAGAGLSDTVAAALWVADSLGRYAEYGPSAVARFLFKSDDAAYALLDGDDRPRPTYGAYWLLARRFGDRLIDTKSSAVSIVNAHAALRDDGALTVVLVNKSPQVQRVHIDLGELCASRADQLTLAGDGLSSREFVINGQSLTARNVADGIPAEPIDSAHLFDFEMDRGSFRVVEYRP